jgi:hypothetical protein
LYTSFEPNQGPQPGQSTCQATGQEELPKPEKTTRRSKVKNRKKKKSKTSAPNEQPISFHGVLGD